MNSRLGFQDGTKNKFNVQKSGGRYGANKEVNITSRYESLQRNNVVGDFQFIVLEKFLSQDNELPFFERMIMKLYFWVKEISLVKKKVLGLNKIM